MTTLLIIEPFYGGSHKQLIDTLVDGLKIQEHCCLVTLPAKKWHWRARTGALKLSQIIPDRHEFKTLFASSVLNLAEMIALRPDLSTLHKIIYFHENQLVYPVRKYQDRDFQYGYNQILSCLVADKVLFNSEFNKQTFLETIPKFLKLQPDCRPVGIQEKIAPKCSVLYFPMDIPPVINYEDVDHERILHIVWPHRWEHDKDPDTFISILLDLTSAGLQFKVSMLGQNSQDVPQSVIDARDKLDSKICMWGHIESRKSYINVLRCADVVISTAIHEFFGVAMIEAVAYGCFALCPNRLVYPEFYPSQCLYRSPQHLKEILTDFCLHPRKPRELARELNFDFDRFSTQRLLPLFKTLLFPEL